MADHSSRASNPVGTDIRTGTRSSPSSARFEKLGSVLGQDQDNFVIIPLTTYLKFRGTRTSLTLEIKATGGEKNFNAAQDEVRVIMRARRHDPPDKDDISYRHLPELHRAVAEHQRFVLRGIRDGELDFGRGRRNRDHERDAGQRHRADQRDRRAPRAGRHAGGYPAPVPDRKRACNA